MFSGFHSISVLSRTVLTVTFLALLASCGGGWTFLEPEPAWSELRDVPEDIVGTSNISPLVVQGDRVLLGTVNGVYEAPLAERRNWRQVGAAGLKVHVIREIRPGILLAAGEPASSSVSSMFRSENGGATWTALATVPRSASGAAYTVYDVAAAPSGDLVYANLEGASVAFSTDLGRSFRFTNGLTEPYFGYACVIHFIPQQPQRLYQGCEAPLDDAWIGYYEINAASPGTLGGVTKVMRGAMQDSETNLSNRRPSLLASRAGVLYAGVEGGFLSLQSNATPRWWYRVLSGQASARPYTYVRAAWLNPRDDRHAIWGGLVPDDTSRWSMYESRDGGQSSTLIAAPRSFNLPAIQQIAPTGQRDELVVLVGSAAQGSLTPTKAHVFVYRVDD
jgi:hypothetical protein